MIWAWISLASSSLSLSDASTDPLRVVDLINCISIGSSALGAVALSFLRSELLNNAALHRWFTLVMGVFGAIGTLFILIFSEQQAFQVFGAAVMGLAEIGLFYSYCTAIARRSLGTNAVVLHFSGAMLIAAALTFLTVFVIKASLVFCVALPLASALLFICQSRLSGVFSARLKSRDISESAGPPDATHKPVGVFSHISRLLVGSPGKPMIFPVKLVLGLSLYGLTFGLFRLSASVESVSDYTFNYMLNLTSQLSAALIALIVICWLRQAYWLLSVFGLASFLSGLAVSLVNASALSGFWVFFTTFGMTCIELLTWVLIFEFYRETRLAWGGVFGIIKGVTLLASTLGATFTYFGAPLLDESTQMGITVALIAAMVVVSTSMFSVHDIASLWGYPKRSIQEAPANTGKKTVFLTNTYGLTARESEIAVLLMRGRSEPFISETLFISPHTTHSHIYHIYNKMKVHSRQEFIDICEQELAAEKHRIRSSTS
jgi:DNA-binding CsgD family transcriptional regulator